MRIEERSRPGGGAPRPDVGGAARPGGDAPRPGGGGAARPGGAVARPHGGGAARPGGRGPGSGGGGGPETAPLVRVLAADLQLLAGFAVLGVAALVRDVATSARPGRELVLALALGGAFGVLVHLRLAPSQREAWRPAPPGPGGAPVAPPLRAAGRAAALTLAGAAVLAAAALAVPDVGLALVPIGLAVALALRVVALARWERDRGRQLLAPVGLHPLPAAYRSRPRL